MQAKTDYAAKDQLQSQLSQPIDCVAEKEENHQRRRDSGDWDDAAVPMVGLLR